MRPDGRRGRAASGRRRRTNGTVDGWPSTVLPLAAGAFALMVTNASRRPA